MSLKNYIGIALDQSGSMAHLSKAAVKDYNQQIEGIKNAAQEANADTIVSVVDFGVSPTPAERIKLPTFQAGGAIVRRRIVNSSVGALRPMADGEYNATGSSTPLLDAIGELIEVFEKAPDVDDPSVSFLVEAITDGEENSSYKWNKSSLPAKIRKLQTTDRWTFILRVPRGQASRAAQLTGIPLGNILEWEVSEQGYERATVSTQSGFKSYYGGMTRGVRATSGFYSDLSGVTSKQVASALENISHKIQVWDVTSGYGDIKSFVESKNGGFYLLGAAFYELTKKEKAIQDYKQIIIVDRKTGAAYAGLNARRLLGLPDHGSIEVRPGDHGQFRIFVQSTSTNRKLMVGTQVVYFPEAVMGQRRS